MILNPQDLAYLTKILKLVSDEITLPLDDICNLSLPQPSLQDVNIFNFNIYIPFFC